MFILFMNKVFKGRVQVFDIELGMLFQYNQSNPDTFHVQWVYAALYVTKMYNNVLNNKVVKDCIAVSFGYGRVLKVV